MTVLAAVLRFATLDVQSFWFDEATTVGLLHHSFGGMLDRIPDSESTPPLYYVVAWLWARVFGYGEVALRSLSALCGTAAVPVLWAATRRLFSARVAFWVALLAAVSPFLVWYSQEARSYGLLTLLGAVSLWLLARVLDDRRPRDAALWAAACALALATHYFAVFLVAGEAAWLLWAMRGRRAVAAGALAVVGAAGAALLPLALEQERAGLAAFISQESLARRGGEAVKQLTLGFDSPLEALTAAVAIVIVALGICLALIHARRESPHSVRVAATLGVTALLVPFVLALAGKDYVLTRNLILAWLPIAALVAAGLTGRAAGGAGMAALGALAGLSLASTVGVAIEPAWQREDWRGAAEEVGPRRPRAIVVTEAIQARPLRLYRPSAGPAPPAAGNLEEVVLIARRGRDLGDAIPTPPSPTVLGPLGLRVTERITEATYELVRLTPASGRGLLSRDQLRTLALDAARAPAAVLVER